MGYRFRAVRRFVLLAGFALGLVACPCPKPECPAVDPSGPLAPEADGSKPPEGVDAALYASSDGAGQACLILKSLGCPEAEVPDCPGDIRKLVSLGTFEQMNVTCIRQSRTVKRVRTCAVDCKGR